MTPTNELACRQLVELVNDYLEGHLPSEIELRFERHLETCPACATYVQQMKMTIALTGRTVVEGLSPTAQESLVEAFRDWTGREDGNSDTAMRG